MPLLTSITVEPQRYEKPGLSKPEVCVIHAENLHKMTTAKRKRVTLTIYDNLFFNKPS